MANNISEFMTTEEISEVKKMAVNISEFMTTEEISEAWDELVGDAAVILEAVNNRLESLGFDEYSEKEVDAETEKLLEMRDTLETVCGL